jgi:hypothetical protein
LRRPLVTERGVVMIRRIVIGAVTVGLLIFTGGTALAAPVTETHTVKGVVETFVDVVPTCDGGGALYTITTTRNGIEHETLFDDGRVHATFTDTGTFVAVPLNDPTLPSYTGKFTTWGGFNLNSDGVVNGTFTFNVRGTGSDGSTFSYSSAEHFNAVPNGSVNEFFHCHD